MPEFEHRRQRRPGPSGAIESRTDREHVAARHGHRSRAGDIAGEQAAHIPAVQRELRVTDRQVHGGVAEHAVADRALPARAKVVGRGRRVDQCAAEVLPATERPLDADARAELAAWAHLVPALDGHVTRGIAVARARPHCPVLPHFEG